LAETDPRIAALETAQAEYRRGELRAAEEALEGVDFGPEEYSGRLFAVFSMTRGSILAETNRLAAAEQDFLRARTAFEADSDPIGQAQVLFNLGNIAKYGGAFRIARDRYREAQAQFEAAGDPAQARSMWLAVANACIDAQELGELDEALVKFVAAAPPSHGGASKEAELPALDRWSLYSARRKRAEMLGDADSQLACADMAVAAARESCIGQYVGEALLALGVVHVAHKRLGPAVAALREAADLLHAAGDHRAINAVRLLRQLGVEVAATAPDGVAKQSHNIGEIFVFEDPEFLIELNDIRAREGDWSLLSATLGTRSYAAIVGGESGHHHFDLAGLETGTLIVAFAAKPAFWPSLLGIAMQVSKQGSEARAQAKLAEVVSAYSFCFEASIHNYDAAGMNVVSRNLFTLERQLTFAGAGAPLDKGPPPPEFDALLARIHKLAVDYLAMLDQLIGNWSIDGDDARRLDGLTTYHRFLLISGPDTGLGVGQSDEQIAATRPADVTLLRRARFDELQVLAETRGAYPVLLEAIYSELACASLPELLKAITDAETTDGRAEQFADDGGGLRLVLNMWAAAAPRLWESASEVLQMVCEFAAERLNRIRIRMVMAGGPFGHQLSLKFTYLTTAVGRDQVIVALALGKAEQALAYWEASRSRALADWMGRTHFIDKNKIVIRRDFTGWVGEVPPCDLAGIKEATATVQTPILAFFAHENGLQTWLIEPNGTIRSEPAERIDDLVDSLMADLPYGADPKDLLRGPLDDFFLDTDDSSQINHTLDELTRRVIPRPLLDVLTKSCAKGLVIMPDAELDMLPFCCLRANGRYLVEQFEISYWPCVSAWKLCHRTMNGRQNLQPVVFGNPDFSVLKGQGMDFSSLPQSELEAALIAKRLKVNPIGGTDASAKTLRAMYQSAAPVRASIPILHLATHGALDMAQPERSFIALADGALTVDGLRLDDRAYRTGLTVLSACQTGLGHRHPDSMIGLTSGFFIAGACAVLSSLWKVPDSSTRTLMERFYEFLLASPKARPAEALAMAQRQALADRNTAHPFRWAAFRLAGADLHPCPDLVADAKTM
jgi:tetratricopeptide (TPR) repeat protein